MTQITNYTTLQTAIGNLLVRTDLASDIPGFIQDVEAELRSDPRARRLVNRGDFSISGDGTSLPDDLFEIESWVHDSSTLRDTIEIVEPNMIPSLKKQYGTTGVPYYAAIVAGKARYAPEPDATYTTRMTYWSKLKRLSASNPTNWLLLERPDIYKYGAAKFAAPLLRDDQRISMWSQMYENALNQLHAATQRARFGGSLRRQVRPIG